MSGDLRLPPTSPSQEVPQEPARPPCATNFLLGIIEIGKFANLAMTQLEAERASQFAEDHFLNAILGSRTASDQDCENCLEGRGIACPLKDGLQANTANNAEYLETSISDAEEMPTKLKLLRDLTAVPDRRIHELLRRGGLSGQKPPDRLLIEELSLHGFWQPAIGDKPQIKTHESIPLKIVPDPRPPEGKEIEYLATRAERRPNCAKKLSQFLIERHEAKIRWKKKSSGLPGEQKSVFKHPKSLKTYDSAVIDSEDATELDCSKCLGENCPLKTGVDGAELFEVTISAVEISGVNVKTRLRIVNRLKGLPKERMAGPPEPHLVADLIEKQFTELKPHPEQ
jgi:hypothetical protein